MLNTLDWIFDWQVAIMERANTGQLHDTNGTYNFFRTFYKMMNEAFVLPDQDISRKAGFIIKGHLINDDPDQLRDLYYGKTASDEFDQKLFTELKKFAASYQCHGLPALFVGRNITIEELPEEKKLVAELFIRTEPLCYIANQAVCLPDLGWFTKAVLKNNRDDFCICAFEIISHSPLAGRISFAPTKDNISVIGNRVKIPRYRFEWNLSREDFERGATFFNGLTLNLFVGEFENDVRFPLSNVFSLRPDELKFMQKLLPHLEVNPEQFLFDFRERVNGRFMEKAVIDAMFRRYAFGEQEAFQQLLSPWLEKCTAKGEMPMGLPRFITLDL